MVEGITQRRKEEEAGIELKCFRLRTRMGDGLRRAQNLGMYDYWEDIENIEGYCSLPNFEGGYQLTLTDDPYYVTTKHKGEQVATYSTYEGRTGVSGLLAHSIANRKGEITLRGRYSMSEWKKRGEFYFIAQKGECPARQRPRIN